MSERGGIVVLDFGGQYTQLIARRIREQQVFSAILPCTAAIEQIRKFEPVGIVLSGGPNSVYDAGRAAMRHRRAVHGIAGPGNLLRAAVDDAHSGRARGARRPPGVWANRTAGEGWLAAVRRPSAKTAHLEQPRRSRARAARRISRDRRNRTTRCPPPKIRHGNCTPCNFIPKCGTPIAARKFCAISFLISATPSRCGAARHSSPKPWSRSASRWATARAICALSGGVDSAVAAVLVHRAIGRPPDQYFCEQRRCCGRTNFARRWNCCATAWA